MSDTLFLMFCTNDADNGNHTGRADAFEFDDLLKLEGYSVVCRQVGDKLKIHRRHFPIETYGSWIGNWCWDGARVTIETANEIAAYLKALDKFDCVEGAEELYWNWIDGKVIDFGKVQP